MRLGQLQFRSLWNNLFVLVDGEVWVSFFYAKLKISLLPCHVAKNCALSPQIIKEKQNTLDKCLSKYLGGNKKNIPGF